MTSQKKLRILCLHGMVQNATVFRKKTSVIRKKLDKMADMGKLPSYELVNTPLIFYL
jgi:hypothetical protein